MLNQYLNKSSSGDKVQEKILWLGERKGNELLLRTPSVLRMEKWAVSLGGRKPILKSLCDLGQVTEFSEPLFSVKCEYDGDYKWLQFFFLSCTCALSKETFQAYHWEVESHFACCKQCWLTLVYTETALWQGAGLETSVLCSLLRFCLCLRTSLGWPAGRRAGMLGRTEVSQLIIHRDLRAHCLATHSFPELWCKET